MNVRWIGLGALAIAAAACTPEETPAQKLTGLCTQALDGDDRIARDIAQNAGSVEAFCGCFGTTTVAADRTELHTQAFEALIAARAAGGLGAEEGARAVMDAVDENPDDYPFTRRQFDDIGDFLETLGDGMEREGACPTP